MNKTTQQWFKKLPEPYRTQALDNLSREPDYVKNAESPSIVSALVSGFEWEKTPEGFDYWDDFWMKLAKGQ
jgi:hypothetical protein